MQVDLRVAQLLSSRLCHDLVGPIGAVNTGLELFQEGFDDDEKALGLVADSAGEATRRLSECLADGATIVNYGLLGGKPCMVPADRVIFKGLTLTGFWLVEHLGAMTRDEKAAFYGDLAARIADGSLMVGVEAVYPIEDITGALEHARRKGRDGKILVAPGGPFGGGRAIPAC